MCSSWKDGFLDDSKDDSEEIIRKRWALEGGKFMDDRCIKVCDMWQGIL